MIGDEFAIKLLLSILLGLQIIISIYMLICQIKRNKEDKKFWEQMDKAIKEQVDRYNNLYPDEQLKLKEDSSGTRRRNKK